MCRVSILQVLTEFRSMDNPEALLCFAEALEHPTKVFGTQPVQRSVPREETAYTCWSDHDDTVVCRRRLLAWADGLHYPENIHALRRCYSKAIEPRS